MYWDKPFAKSDTFLGLDFTQAMGTDLSEKRMTEYRSFDATDTMNNLYAGTGLKPKYLMPDIDTYVQGPEDNLYSGYQTAYLKLGRVPGPDEDWTPVLKAMRDGDFFVTTGGDSDQELCGRRQREQADGDRGRELDLSA